MIPAPQPSPVVAIASTSAQKKARKWCFTLNNPTEDEIVMIAFRMTAGIVYMIYGREHFDGAEGHTPHLQGYIEYRNYGVTMS